MGWNNFRNDHLNYYWTKRRAYFCQGTPDCLYLRRNVSWYGHPGHRVQVWTVTECKHGGLLPSKHLHPGNHLENNQTWWMLQINCVKTQALIQCTKHGAFLGTFLEWEYVMFFFFIFFFACSHSGIVRMVVYAIPCIMLFAWGRMNRMCITKKVFMS